MFEREKQTTLKNVGNKSCITFNDITSDFAQDKGLLRQVEKLVQKVTFFPKSFSFN